MRYVRLLLPLVSFALSASSLAQSNFAPVITYGSGGPEAYSVAVADVNGDGKPDLVVANACEVCENGTVGVLLGNGDGSFQSAVTYGSGGFGATSVAIADVNGDSKTDLVVANLCAIYGSCPEGGSVSVLLGNGDGTFQKAIAYGSGGADAYSVAVADVNGDGKPDLIVANQCVSSSDCHGEVSVLLGNGDGTFQTAVSYGTGGGGEALSVAVGDVNGDGKPDLLVANLFCGSITCGGEGADGSVAVLLGNGDGTFQRAVPYDSGGSGALAVAVADVNGDGKPDLVVANQCINGNNCATGTVGVLLGNGDGTLQTAVAYGTGGSARGLVLGSVAVADVDGDGKPDIVVTNQCGSSGGDCSNEGAVGLLLGRGDGTFQSAVSYGSGGFYATSVAIGDVNNGGKPDLVVTNRCVSSGSNCGATSNGSVGVLINTTKPIDTTPPVISVSANPATLWPPNGKTVPVTVSGTITDSGSGVNPSTATYIVIDEYGQIQPSGSISLGAGGSYSFATLLQASRDGNDKDGRHYTITVSAKDNAGNLGSASALVLIPHDMGH